VNSDARDPWFWMRWALAAAREYELPAGDAHLLLVLTVYADRTTGECHPSLELLASVGRRSPEAVSRGLGRLTDLGLIERHRRARGKTAITKLIAAAANPAPPDLTPATSQAAFAVSDLLPASNLDLTPATSGDLTPASSRTTNGNSQCGPGEESPDLSSSKAAVGALDASSPGEKDPNPPPSHEQAATAAQAPSPDLPLGASQANGAIPDFRERMQRVASAFAAAPDEVPHELEPGRFDRP
jgi:hypothetical protein